jgi:hypothetical protein
MNKKNTWGSSTPIEGGSLRDDSLLSESQNEDKRSDFGTILVFAPHCGTREDENTLANHFVIAYDHMVNGEL